MQAFNFALRQSTAESVDDNRSRYVPSSIYSGPGPAEESPLPPQPVHSQHHYGLNGVNGINNSNHTGSVNSNARSYQAVHTDLYTQPIRDDRLRTSTVLNLRDPVAIHLLAETALGDSKDFEILSYEELEHLKRDRLVQRNKLESIKKKIALECKLRDAAQSLNRLYVKAKNTDESNGIDLDGHRRNLDGSKSSNSEALSRANEEYAVSSQKITELMHEQKCTVERLEDTKRRILEHTAGILQLTHKGLKKNLRKSEMPRSPESMVSHGHRDIPTRDQIEDFDERSFYLLPDYVHDFVQSNPVTPIIPTSRKLNQDTKVFEGVKNDLHTLGLRLHDLVRQLDPTADPESLPEVSKPNDDGKDSSDLQAQLTYIHSNLDVLIAVQQQTLAESDTMKSRIHKMLERTNSVNRSPMVAQEEPEGKDLASQLAFSTSVLEHLLARVDTLVEQKDILTRQIQQQRELNSKSDAQRDAQIKDLTEELQESKNLQAMAEKDAQASQNEISMLIEQLDRNKQDALLLEQQRGMSESKSLQAERDARKATENQLLEDVAAKQQANVQLQADVAKMQNDFELRSQQHIQQLNEVSSAKEETTIELKRHQAETDKMLEQMAALQTELTIVKAELDGAYGTRAQRAADVSLNPAVQKELDSLGSRNAQLQKELRETIEDYELMTKAGIESEKERDRLESNIDTLRDKCESLESQLSEEKLKWLGLKTQTPTETTSTMVLKNEFKKMMRDTRAENSKVLKAEQEERRRLESLIRTMKKEAGLATPAKSTASSHLSAEPTTPLAKR